MGMDEAIPLITMAPGASGSNSVPQLHHFANQSIRLLCI